MEDGRNNLRASFLAAILLHVMVLACAGFLWSSSVSPSLLSANRDAGLWLTLDTPAPAPEPAVSPEPAPAAPTVNDDRRPAAPAVVPAPEPAAPEPPHAAPPAPVAEAHAPPAAQAPLPAPQRPAPDHEASATTVSAEPGTVSPQASGSQTAAASVVSVPRTSDGDLALLAGDRPDPGGVGPVSHAMTGPRAVADISAQYPGGARRRGEEGSTRVHLAIDARGHVEDVTVLDSSGYRALDEAAVAAARRARFAPATDGGKPVASETDLTFRFRLVD